MMLHSECAYSALKVLNDCDHKSRKAKEFWRRYRPRVSFERTI